MNILNKMISMGMRVPNFSFQFNESLMNVSRSRKASLSSIQAAITSEFIVELSSSLVTFLLFVGWTTESSV